MANMIKQSYVDEVNLQTSSIIWVLEKKTLKVCKCLCSTYYITSFGRLGLVKKQHIYYLAIFAVKELLSFAT